MRKVKKIISSELGELLLQNKHTHVTTSQSDRLNVIGPRKLLAPLHAYPTRLPLSGPPAQYIGFDLYINKSV